MSSALPEHRTPSLGSTLSNTHHRRPTCRYNPDLCPGRAIVVGIDRGIYARVLPLSESVLRVVSTTSTGEEVRQELPLDEDALAQQAQQGGFWSYIAGVAYIFATEFHVGGMLIHNYRTTLPMGRGLSSSAAMCVLVARAFNRCYGLSLTARGEMQAAYEGERLTPSQCGRMDQAVAFGRVPVVMTFSGDVLKVAPARLGGAVHLVLVDLKASKDTVHILSSLQQAYPHPKTPEELSLAALLGPLNEDITARAAAALESGDAQALGAAMQEAQREFDARAGPMCPSMLGEAGSPILHRALAHGAIQEHVWGGKGVGSQGDGTAQLVCRSRACQDAVCAALEADLQVECIKVDLHPSEGEEG